MAAEIRKMSPPHKRARIQATRFEDDYMRGNILKIEVHNFMTYSHIETSPGPRLNLVIGPNGTGKSSLVCALAIGLGGEPQLLGRAAQVRDFVKHGEESGWIKISLRGDAPDEVIVIKREINKQNKSEWSLNGRSATKKLIQESVRQFNIQVDNLTQFLPQDRVCEFARMTPVQLLEETEKAVGDPELSEQHCTLIKRNQELKQRQVTVRQLESTLNQHKANNAELERDVERVQQRNRLYEQADKLKLKLPWLKYDKEKSLYKDAKEQEKEAKQKLEDMKREILRMRAPIEEQRSRREELESAREELRLSKTRNERRRGDIESSENDLRERVKTKMAAIEELHRNEANRQHKLENARKALEDSEKEFENLTVEEPPREHMESLGLQIQQYEEEAQEKRICINDIVALENQRKSQINAYERRIKEIQNVTNQRLQILKNSGAKMIYEAYKWVEEHRQEFKQHIFGPVLLEVSIPDKDLAAYVEGHVSNYIWKAFITQDAEDRDRLFKSLKPYGVPVINFTGNEFQASGPSITEQMRNLGITKTLDQVITAPDVVKNVLIGQFALNHSFIGDSESNRRADEVCKLGIRDLWTPENHFRWQESRYGGPMSASVNPVRPARLFSPSLDMSELNELEGKIAEANSVLGELKDQIKAITRRLRECEDKAAVFHKEREVIVNRARDSRRKRQDMKHRIEQRSRALQALEDEETVESAEAKIRQDITGINGRRIDKALQLKNSFLEAVKCHILYSARSLAYAEADAKVKAMERGFREQETLGIHAQQDYDSSKSELLRCRARLEKAKEDAENIARITPELQAEFEKMPDTVEDLEDAIEDCQTQARTVFCPNPNVLEEYERRCAQIAEATARFEVESAGLDSCRGEIERIRALWLTSLRAIVGKINTTFSRNFEEMAVAGEVTLDEHGTDFDKYGIHIKVKFRQEEALQVLSGQHQSGGERSVATILYLVSLQDLTHCPFRAVDEINQGMDPINERKMFQQLVRAASQPNTPQCFLLTPKLLPDLEYSEACSVLNIMNGPWIAASVQAWRGGRSWAEVRNNVGVVN